MAELKSSPWIVRPQIKRFAKLRLVCLPYAGGSATTYLSWTQHLHPSAELVAVQPPGRSMRFTDPIIDDVDQYLDELKYAVLPFTNLPYIVIGHSMGAKMGYELVKQLVSSGCSLPTHFIASGSPAPCVERYSKSVNAMSDQCLVDYLSELTGSSDDALKNEEIIKLCLPAVRADFKILESYKFEFTEPFNCPLTIFGGTKDSSIPVAELSSWADHFTSSNIKMFDGDHFFIDNQRADVIASVNEIVEATLDGLSQTKRIKVAGL